MKRGQSTKETWLSAKGGMPSFTISPHAASTGEQKVMAHRNYHNAASRPSTYQTVTTRIIASLKAGAIPWEKAWETRHYAGGPFPRNVYICVELAWLEDEGQPQIFKRKHEKEFVC
jgi:hypothetical protein